MIGICPSSVFCARMGPRSTDRVIRDRLMGRGIMRELLFRRPALSRGGMRGRGSVSFCGGRSHITLECYNRVGPRGVFRCVKYGKCVTLNGYVSRLSPVRIMRRVGTSKLEKENNTNFPANVGLRSTSRAVRGLLWGV